MSMHLYYYKEQNRVLYPLNAEKLKTVWKVIQTKAISSSYSPNPSRAVTEYVSTNPDRQLV